MLSQEREILVNRILSGLLKFNDLVIKNASIEDKVLADELYTDVYESALYEGLWSDEELLSILYDKKIWTIDLDNRFTGLQKDIEELKKKLYQIQFQTNELRIVRTKLAEAKQEVNELYKKRHQFDFLTAAGTAEAVRQKFVLSRSIYKYSKLLFDNFDEADDVILNKALIFVYNSIPCEREYRELVRTEPFSSIWIAANKNAYNLFSLPIINLTEQQKYLISWAKLYDNIRESNDYPGDNVMEDDDRLDGWLLLQREKIKQASNQQKIDDQLPDKIKNANNIFIPTSNNPEDIKKVDDLNDPIAKMMKNRRTKMLKEKGKVHELQMPDTRERMIEEYHNLRRGK